MVPVLLIEDLVPTGVFSSILRRQGYRLLGARSADAPAIVILTAGPSVEGATRAVPALKERFPEAAIVVLAETARETAARAILAAGADDFHSIPIALGEFLARLRRLAERTLASASPGPVLSFGNAHLSVAGRSLTAGDRVAKLTPLEAELLAVLIRARGVPVERATLAASVRHAGKPTSPRTIDSHLSHLRTKLRRARVGVTVYSVYRAGYRVAEVG